MEKREKIIVVFAALALLYGVYVLFLEPKPQAPTFASAKNDLDTLNSFITKVATATKVGLSERDSYIIQKAENQWRRDPFIRIKKRTQAEVEAQEIHELAEPKYEILYTGYLEMGTIRLAIINGNEYETGDRLDQGDYIVRSISSTQVVVATTDGSKNLFIVPLQEIQ